MWPASLLFVFASELVEPTRCKFEMAIYSLPAVCAHDFASEPAMSEEALLETKRRVT